jgi:YesN/AraC family two-component response regulator
MSNRKKYTSVLTIMFATIALLLLLIISTFFIKAINIYKKSNAEFEERYLVQAVNAVEMVIKQINKSLEASSRNNSITNYITFPRGQYFENLKGSIDEEDKSGLYDYLKTKSLMKSSLNDLSFSNDYLNSVYFYDGKNELFYTDDNRQFSRVSFPDSSGISFTQKLANEDIGTYIFDIRTEKEINDGKTLLSVIYLNEKDGYNYYLISNLDIRKMSEDIFDGLNGINDGDIYVVNDDGDIILSNNPDFIGNNIEKIEDKALSIKKNTGEWKIEIDDDDLQVSSHPTDIFSWYVVSVNRNEGLNEDIRQLSTNIIITAVFALLISVLSAFFVARKLYRPINNIIDKIEKSDPSIRKSDEFEEILDFIDQNSKMRDNLKLSLPMYNEKVLEWKLSGQSLKPENQALIYQILNIKDASDKVAVIAAAGDWQNRTMQNNLTEIISSEIKCSVLSINSYMIYFCHDTEKNMKSAIENISQKIAAIDEDVWVGAGNVVRFEDCAESYQQAVFSIGVLKTRRKTGLITYGEFVKENIGIIDLMNNNKQMALEQAIKLSDFNQAKRIYKDAVDEIKEYLPTLSTFQIRNELFLLNMRVFNCINGYMPNNELSILHNKILSEINSEDLDIIKDDTLELIGLMQSLSDNLQNQRLFDDYVDQAKAIINTEYNNDVSLIGVADRLGITPEYLSKLFKEKERIGFIDYLTKCRMQKAKELIVNLDYNISKIAEMVGFQNTEYFSRVFKKHFGIPPGKYRHQAKILGDKSKKL